MLHKLAHWFGWNIGEVYTWYDSDTGKLMVGFKCSTCGDISGVQLCRTLTVTTRGVEALQNGKL